MDTHPSLQEAQAHYQSTEEALRALLPSGAVPAAQDATQQLMTAFTLAQVIAAAQRASQPEPAPTCAPPKRRKAAAGKQRATRKKTSGPPVSSTAGPLAQPAPSGGSPATGMHSGMSTASVDVVSESPTTSASPTTSGSSSGRSRKRRTTPTGRKRGRPAKSRSSAGADNNADASRARPAVTDDGADTGSEPDHDEDIAEYSEHLSGEGSDDENPPGAPQAVPGPAVGGPLWEEYKYTEDPDMDVRTWQHTPPPEVARGGSRRLDRRHVFLRTPGAIFMRFLDQRLLEPVVTASNAWHMSNLEPWHNTNHMIVEPITRKDILRFILAIFMMGLCRLPNLKMYWNSDFKTSWITRLFPTYIHFQRVLRALHFVDTSSVPQAEQKIRNRADPFWKLGEFTETLSDIFVNYRVPDGRLTCDEFTIPCRAPHCARCFNPAKPIRYHLKGWSLINEASAGYCLRLYMTLYRGRDEKRPPDVPASAFPTWKLIGEYPEIHHRGYHLFADNWFSSLRVVRDLHRVGVGYTGTVRVNRTDNAFLDTKEWKRKAKRGDYRAKQSSCAAGAPSLYCTQWMDNKPVTILTTEPGIVGTIVRRVSDKSTRTWGTKTYTVPSCVTNYNQGKVGTDRMDQMIAQLYFKNRFHWHVKCFIHFMYIILHNAHITWKEVRDPPPKGQGSSKTSLRYFLMELVRELYSNLDSFHVKTTTPTHAPTTTSTRTGKRKKQGYCKYCQQKCSTWCASCDKFLHLDGAVDGEQCWSKFHLLSK